ncbi:hypothetical protein [Bacillus cereus]|uniref:hypothetical protein n=1 Tax=Bacillus cereus TaxID=1396 RepID=UPI0013E2963B|nr:hypothetical protein [Bacillus cereus]
MECQMVTIEFNSDTLVDYIWDYEEPIINVINKFKAISLTEFQSREKHVIIVSNIRRIW